MEGSLNDSVNLKLGRMEKYDVPKTIVLSKSNMQVVLFPPAVKVVHPKYYKHLKKGAHQSLSVVLLLELWLETSNTKHIMHYSIWYF